MQGEGPEGIWDLRCRYPGERQLCGRVGPTRLSRKIAFQPMLVRASEARIFRFGGKFARVWWDEKKRRERRGKDERRVKEMAMRKRGEHMSDHHV